MNGSQLCKRKVSIAIVPCPIAALHYIHQQQHLLWMASSSYLCENIRSLEPCWSRCQEVKNFYSCDAQSKSLWLLLYLKWVRCIVLFETYAARKRIKITEWLWWSIALSIFIPTLCAAWSIHQILAYIRQKLHLDLSVHSLTYQECSSLFKSQLIWHVFCCHKDGLSPSQT